MSPKPLIAQSRFFPFLVLVLVLLPSAIAVAREAEEWAPVRKPQLRTRPAAGPIEIDGLLDDPGWRDLPRARNFAEHQPGDQVQPPVATEALLTYDDDYLYAAFVCHDDPDLVRASFTERDRIWQDDYVILLLDTFAHAAWSYEIAVNPYGIQGDLLWSAGYGEDLTYDLVYYSSGRITDEGWQVELAIPWSSLQFPDVPEQTWRVDFWRNHPREVRGQYSWAKYDRDESCWPCQWGTVTGIAGVSPGAGFELLPAFVASQTSERRDDGSFGHGDVMGEPSLGATYRIGPTAAVEATLNPDFSQVESDAAQIDVNSPFALFYPEKRPFFQEGSDLWTTNFNVVYTRSINRPFYAAKVTGRPGRSNFVAMTAQDEASPFILPFADGSAVLEGGRSWSTMGRYRRTVGEESHVGLIATDRRHEGGGSGTTGGVDGRVRLGRNYYLEGQALASHTEEPVAPELTAELDGETFDRGRHTKSFDGESFSGHGIYGSFERGGRHWNLDLDYWERSPTFRTENGFEPRNDRREALAWTAYTFYLEEGLLNRIQPTANAGRVWDCAGTKKDEWVYAGLWTQFNWAQATLSFYHMESNELFQGIQFDGIHSTEVQFEIKPAEVFQGGGFASFGHRIARYDLVMGRETNLQAWFTIKPFSRFTWENTFGHLRSDDVDTGRRLFRGYVARSRFNLQLTREWSARLILQYDDFRRTWEADPLLTFRLNPFSIFYIGSTRGYGEYDGAVAGLEGWRLTDRTYFMKIQYLWQI